jgi:hypothetical protein
MVSVGGRSLHTPGSGAAPAGETNGNGERRRTTESEATETTTLLGGEDENGGAAPRKDSWVGFEDFEGLPWWKRPSVGYRCTSAVCAWLRVEGLCSQIGLTCCAIL